MLVVRSFRRLRHIKDEPLGCCCCCFAEVLKRPSLVFLQDVVHGTRHDFFMSEYRANYDIQWLNLLLARGFDPAKVECEYRHLLWKVVD